MNFFKIKHIGIRMDGNIICYLTTGDTVIKTKTGFFMGYMPMTPLYDCKTNELVGFFNPDEVNVEIEEE